LNKLKPIKLKSKTQHENPYAFIIQYIYEKPAHRPCKPKKLECPQRKFDLRGSAGRAL
jgi:hypothetical protein